MRRSNIGDERRAFFFSTPAKRRVGSAKKTLSIFALASFVGSHVLLSHPLHAPLVGRGMEMDLMPMRTHQPDIVFDLMAALAPVVTR